MQKKAKLETSSSNWNLTCTDLQFARLFSPVFFLPHSHSLTVKNLKYEPREAKYFIAAPRPGSGFDARERVWNFGSTLAASIHHSLFAAHNEAIVRAVFFENAYFWNLWCYRCGEGIRRVTYMTKSTYKLLMSYSDNIVYSDNLLKIKKNHKCSKYAIYGT